MIARDPLPSQRVIYSPSDWGAEFHRLEHDEALGAGAAGVGKSTVLRMEPLAQIYADHDRCVRASDHEHPLKWGDSRGWALYLRRTHPMLLDTKGFIKATFPQIDPGFTWYERDSFGEFSSGFKFQLGHCNNPDDWQQYLSREFTIVCFDELVTFLEEQYDQIIMRVRCTDPVLREMLKVRSMSNPAIVRADGERYTTIDPQWVRRRFVEPARHGRVTLEREVLFDGIRKSFTGIYLPGTIDDNPDKVFAEQYKMRLASSKPHIRRAFLEGDWWVTASSFFADAWNERLHVIRPFKIPREWKVWRSMDWGFKAPGCVHWMAMDDDETVYVFREFKFRGLHDYQVAKAIVEIERGLDMDLVDSKGRSRITGPADTQIWEQRGSGKTMAAVMAENGVPWVPADKSPHSNQVHAGRVYKRLEDHADGTKTPGLVFFANCTWILEVLPGLETSPKNPEEPMDGGDDHPWDSLKYGVTFASRGRRGIPDRRREPEKWEEDEERAPRASMKRGQFGYGVG